MSKVFLTGIVISAKSDKTIKVAVLVVFKHKVYGKFIRRHRKYIVHDSENKYNPGDVVRIKESVPISSTKRWTVV